MSERENTQSIIGCSSGAWFPDYALGNSIFVYTVGEMFPGYELTIARDL